ncbi:ergothioneine biosynthesis protein EgtC [Streptomyces griseocarneus]|uniref:ergothioneine biosynthesis protein EgtC n=1 Tax=Streptomyces griseocarneus TaxID=51201 RepID=UPI00167DC27E|nr:ergothioneine biosynthesis protein EgtC [Streptomyces griseocarneus]MBZ6474844.1 ergothioneine biosynthesis protein EgtC [Streptomyces griseocarneus]GHG48419.1 gamma-glutamyl-hercynylcysteine sulfoxide hydrolase [Streptomyces griseocarneus]
MCRHIAVLGPDAPLAETLVEPPHSLVHQSWAPRSMASGTVNADGFGVGWYAPGDPRPARYRRAGPIWGDESFADIARVVRTRALLAAVRDATLRSADQEAATAPFAGGPWLFSHNGALKGWPGSAAPLITLLPPEALLRLTARSDSAFVWALVEQRLLGGEGLGPALAGTVTTLIQAAPGSTLNLLLTDGAAVAATAWGDSLWYLAGGGRERTVVASEPYDDDPRWRRVPDRSLLTADRSGVGVSPLVPPHSPRPPRRPPHPPEFPRKEPVQ